MFSNLLANNTCDLEEDIKNQRKTLVYYLGKKRAVQLLVTLYLFNALLIVCLVILNLAPFTILCLLLIYPWGWKTLKIYQILQDKKLTFPLVLKVMSVTMVGYPLLFFIGSFL
ncbi:MAG: hypothetical protein ACTH2W_09970 [Vagococcus sp.]